MQDKQEEESNKEKKSNFLVLKSLLAYNFEFYNTDHKLQVSSEQEGVMPQVTAPESLQQMVCPFVDMSYQSSVKPESYSPKYMIICICRIS